MRGDLENLGDLAGRKSRARMKSVYRRLLTIALIAVLALAAGYGIHQSRARAEAEKEKAEYRSTAVENRDHPLLRASDPEKETE